MEKLNFEFKCDGNQLGCWYGKRVEYVLPNAKKKLNRQKQLYWKMSNGKDKKLVILVKNEQISTYRSNPRSSYKG
jgi:hypothetical protein